MPVKVEAQINPELLVWARQSAGLDCDSAAKKVPVKPERLEAWERGDGRPTVKQLRKLARGYKRPLALFYLSEPPTDFQPMHDFRRLPGEIAGVESPQLKFEIRRALNRGDIALELFESARGQPKEFTLTAEMDDDPDELAFRIRSTLGVDLSTQVSWRAGYESFNGWRAAIERLDILVFQLTDVALSETRGFSISHLSLPVIAVNIKDPPTARSFSLIHELIHLMLRRGGICDLDEHTARAPEELRTEVFANMVAGATLLPRDAVLIDPDVRGKRASHTWQDDELQRLADKYGVSREAMLRRLLILGRTTEAFYLQKRDQFQLEYVKRHATREPGFAPPHRIAISSAGMVFVQVVLANYYQQNITASDVADFLEVKLKHLAKIEAEVFGRGGIAA